MPKKRKGSDPLHYLAIDGDGKVLACLFPEVKYEFFGFGYTEDCVVVSAPLHQPFGLTPIDRFLPVAAEAYNRGVVRKLKQFDSCRI